MTRKKKPIGDRIANGIGTLLGWVFVLAFLYVMLLIATNPTGTR